MRDAITYSGPLRLYFDPSTLGDAHWCIDGIANEWQIHVRDVSIDVHMRCVYSLHGNERPLAASAWLEGRANVTITSDGRAFLKPEEPKS